MTPTPLPDKVVAIDTGLSNARIDHAFGGAIALAYYAEPRATIDIDVNLFIPANEHEAVAAALGPLAVAAAEDPGRIERDGQTRWWWGETPVDLFFAYDAFHEAMRRAVRRVQFGEARIPILAPEHLIVCKVAVDRPKDWLDIEQMLLVEDLDLDELRRWSSRVVGSEDSRTKRLEKLFGRRL